MAERRLRQDLMKMNKDPPPGISADPSDDSILIWDAVIFGPYDTPFQHGMFKLKLTFPANYPNSPPKASFVSKMFHPNVYQDGKICIDILQCQSKWKPEYDASAVLVAIQVMLGEPNPNSPANQEAKDLYVNNTQEYEKRVKQIVDLSQNES